jgi:hypothetical protein
VSGILDCWHASVSMAWGGRNPVLVVLALFGAASFLTFGLVLVEAAEVSIAAAESGNTQIVGDFVVIGVFVVLAVVLGGLIRGIAMDAM